MATAIFRWPDRCRTTTERVPALVHSTPASEIWIKWRLRINKGLEGGRDKYLEVAKCLGDKPRITVCTVSRERLGRAG